LINFVAELEREPAAMMSRESTLATFDSATDAGDFTSGGASDDLRMWRNLNSRGISELLLWLALNSTPFEAPEMSGTALSLSRTKGNGSDGQ